MVGWWGNLPSCRKIKAKVSIMPTMEYSPRTTAVGFMALPWTVALDFAKELLGELPTLFAGQSRGIYRANLYGLIRDRNKTDALAGMIRDYEHSGRQD